MSARKLSLFTLVPYVLPLALFIYGAGCVVTQHALIPKRYSWGLKITGPAAVMAGVSYMALAVFIVLSFGSPPRNKSWSWRIGRWALRWSALAAMVICSWQAWEIWDGSPLVNPFAGPHGGIATVLATAFNPLALKLWFIFMVMVLLFFLHAMFEREQVKKDLDARGLTPAHIVWRPWAYWNTFIYGTAFYVVYAGLDGVLQDAYCYTSRLGRRVNWLEDN